MKSVVGLHMICLVKMKYLFKSGHLKHRKEIYLFLFWELYLERARALVPVPQHA